MDTEQLIDKYYADNPALRHILVTHSQAVAKKALEIAQKHPELGLDTTFLEEAAMVHDIGIYMTDAEGIMCFGDKPNICHGYLGAELMRREGYPRHALVCERHTGAGISLAQIVEKQMPLPHREMVPITLEEQAICFADKFFSKSRLEKEKTVESARRSLEKFGDEGVKRFDHWCEIFL